MLDAKLHGASRDELEVKAKTTRRKNEARPAVRVDSIRCALPSGRFIVVSGPNLSLDDVVETFVEAIKEARRAAKGILWSLIRLGRQVGGVIFGAKPEDLHEAQELFRAAGRLEDLRVFAPDSGSTCNYMDFIVKVCGHDPREVAKFLGVIKESVQTSEAKGGGGEMGDFWITAQEEQLFNAVVPVLLAEGEVRPDTLRDFILGAAHEPAQVDDPKWREKGHNTVLRKAHQAAKRRTDMLDLESATKYWTRR